MANQELEKAWDSANIHPALRENSVKARVFDAAIFEGYLNVGNFYQETLRQANTLKIFPHADTDEKEKHINLCHISNIEGIVSMAKINMVMTSMRTASGMLFPKDQKIISPDDFYINIENLLPVNDSGIDLYFSMQKKSPFRDFASPEYHSYTKKAFYMSTLYALQKLQHNGIKYANELKSEYVMYDLNGLKSSDYFDIERSGHNLFLKILKEPPLKALDNETGKLECKLNQGPP